MANHLLTQGWIRSSVCLLLRARQMTWRCVSTCQIVRADVKRQPIIPSFPRLTPTHFKQLEELPIIHVHTTSNNTICTLCDVKGKVLSWTSSGTVGFKKARRGTAFSAQVVGIATAKKALAHGINKVNVRIKGFSLGRTGALQGLSKGGLQVSAITDSTPISWGGCRPRKVRRV
ncbi:small ribosomal subunit protein uS11-like [Dysidea avara]|uniref:small ribosomal subunit protein uS11-like n=1 Tax=Dysidea avara TaxID=196820 RepID=UPI00331DA3C4